MGRFTKALTDHTSGYEKRTFEGKFGGVDIKIQALPITPRDIDNITRKHPKFMDMPTPSAMVDLICLKALTMDGEKAFSIGEDGPIMKGMVIEEIGGMFAALFGADFEDGTDFTSDKIETEKND